MRTKRCQERLYLVPLTGLGDRLVATRRRRLEGTTTERSELSTGLDAFRFFLAHRLFEVEGRMMMLQ